jgi:hypothetical protein
LVRIFSFFGDLIMSDTGALAAAQNEAVEETMTAAIESASNEGLATAIEQQSPAQPVVSTEEVSQDRRDAYPTQQREEAVARIRKSNLPPVMRERLATVMETSESPYLDVAVCLEAIEETLPEFLRTNRGSIARPSHPVGETFFHGTEELTDAEAEALATKQLERSGLLRGQRARTAD